VSASESERELELELAWQLALEWGSLAWQLALESELAPDSVLELASMQECLR